MKETSEHLDLKEPKPQDYSLVKSIWEDEATMAAVGGIWPLSYDDYKRWYEEIIVNGRKQHRYYLIMLGDKCVGEVSFHRYNPEQKTAELNIKVKYNWRHQGIGHWALLYLLDIFFNEWNGEAMLDLVRKDNTGSHRMLEACGFEKIRSGHDEILYRLNRKDYKYYPKSE